ncbi:hypothetical protein Tco_1448318 [Tanacetum coccineum]
MDCQSKGGSGPFDVICQVSLVRVVREDMMSSSSGLSRKSDAYDFSSEGFPAHTLLFRYDSTGDFYPVTQQPPFTSPFALISFSSTMWHRRLDHSGDNVLRPVLFGLLLISFATTTPSEAHTPKVVGAEKAVHRTNAGGGWGGWDK